MYYDVGYMGYFGWFLMVLAMVLFWGFFIWLIIWIVNRGRTPESNSRTPLEIAKERLAKGEITKKQFDEIKKEL